MVYTVVYTNLNFEGHLLDCRVLGTELTEFGEGCGGLAGVDRFSGHGYAFLEVEGESGGIESSGGVQQYDVAAGARNAREDVIEVSGVGGDVAAGELVESGAGQAGHFGSDAGGFYRGRLTGVGLFDTGNDGFAGGG